MYQFWFLMKERQPSICKTAGDLNHFTPETFLPTCVLSLRIPKNNWSYQQKLITILLISQSLLPSLQFSTKLFKYLRISFNSTPFSSAWRSYRDPFLEHKTTIVTFKVMYSYTGTDPGGGEGGVDGVARYPPCLVMEPHRHTFSRKVVYM